MRAIILLFAIVGTSAPAAEQRIDCPKEIKRDTIEIKRAPAGWTPFYLHEFEPGLPLNGAGLMWGPPSTMTMSKPSWSGEIHGKEVVVWAELGGKASGEKWMACYYGDHQQNDAILSRRIDDGVTECTVTYAKKRGAGIAILCK
ncbi:MAG: STY0301 family protein [Duganella sp.]